MPLIPFLINTFVVGDTVVVPKAGFVVDVVNVTRLPGGTDVDILLGANQSIAIGGPGYLDGIQREYSQDSQEGLIIRNNVAVIGAMEGFVSVQTQDLHAAGIRAGS